MSEIAGKWDEVNQRISDACKRAGRDVSDVTLIAVSKTKPLEMLADAYDAGARVFGENKVQELVQKIENAPFTNDVDWHLIGHLQRNKVKYLFEEGRCRVALIHSVDSFRLAEEINIQAKKHHAIAPVLIEVNAAGEETKFGVSCEDAKELVRQISAELDAVSVRGLMTIAPYIVDSEENRAIFHKIRDLSVDIASENIDNISMDILSMGMTNDYEVAIEEGATMVRVGTGIFGERNYATV